SQASKSAVLGARELRAGRCRAGVWGLFAITWFTSPVLGCSGPPGAGLHLGTDLGTFQILASESSNDCGAGVLGETPSLDYQVDLERDYTQLFWNGSGGTVSDDGSFSISAVVRMQMSVPSAPDDAPNFSTEPDMPVAPCVIERQDAISGTLVSDGTGGFASLTATSSYNFDVESDARCTLAQEAAAGLPNLPCGIRYTLRGTRTRTPDQPAMLQTPGAAGAPSAPR
ncbi:MAG TPA: hypothetical protein VG963_27720, partial [Polyangiaceae bacterium]|nr:hypothetical protein [Polyangiaceae bacterium]